MAEFNYDNLLNLIIDNLKKLLYPEEWIGLDMSFSKSELFAMLLVERQGEIIMSQIADYINIPMSTATGIVDRLVRNGYMMRDRSESDRRVVVIKLTDKGREAIGRLKGLVGRYASKVYDSLEEEEKALLFKVFTKVLAILSGEGSPEASEKVDGKSKIKKIYVE